jgi:aldehyde dehydrogenase (NAD+)
MAVRAIVFSAVGTAGQRCTTLRRLLVHRSIRDDLVARVRKAYGTLPIGDPRAPGTLVGPLIDGGSRERMMGALERARAEGGVVHGGRAVSTGVPAGGVYVEPAIVEMPVQNDVPQGLSSCIFTTDLREAETFLSAVGSDCGIANVNMGPSGAEIGGAFGGEKETGGGRESGSDSWRAYMRRQTNSINYSRSLPLAQGVNFDI